MDPAAKSGSRKPVRARRSIAGRAYYGFQANGSVADSHGIWFAGYGSTVYGGSTSGVALYVRGQGLYFMSGIGGQLAGGCD